MDELAMGSLASELDDFFDARAALEATEGLFGCFEEELKEQPDLSEQIAALSNDGFSAEEIGKALEIPRARVIRIARRKGIALAKAGGRRRILVELSADQVEMIGSLADGAKVTRSVMLARIVLAALAEGEDRTYRRLGKHARPKRTYKARNKA